MSNIKFTLYENAISSFYIAKKNFVKLYYTQSETLTNKMLDEHAKIGLIFLENSIELMLKAILSVDDPLCIYIEPNSRVIQQALSKISESNRLEDILIRNGNFKTITFTKAVDLYVKKYQKPDKVKRVLYILGDKRNAVTHFGIDETTTNSELIACFINAFDVIYNYLYPHLIKLNDIGHYFTDDMIYESYLGTAEFFYDPDTNMYNNIVDFLDELLCGAGSYVFELRKDNTDFKINFFIDILKQVVNDTSFNSELNKMNSTISVNDFFSGETPECRFIDLDFHNDYYELDDIYIAWKYSIYYNYSYFISMYDELLWVVDHNNNSLMYYNKSIYLDNPYDKAEQEFDFEQDIANNKCQKFTLSKRNLRKVLLEQILALKNEQSEDSSNDQT